MCACFFSSLAELQSNKWYYTKHKVATANRTIIEKQYWLPDVYAIVVFLLLAILFVLVSLFFLNKLKISPVAHFMHCDRHHTKF